MSICFHELAHLYYQHPLQPTDASQLFERQADRFSGYEMCIAGATIAQSKSAMEAFGNDLNTYTHPPKTERLAEIEKGYIDAKITIFRDTSYIRQRDSLRNRAATLIEQGITAARKNRQAMSGKGLNFIKRPRAIQTTHELYDLLGTTVYFSASGEVRTASGNRLLGRLRPVDKDGVQDIDIQGVKYNIKNGGLIYALAPNGHQLEVGRKIGLFY